MVVERDGRSDWLVVGLALVAGVVGAMHLGKMGPALPSLRESLGLDYVAGGRIASAITVLALCTGLFAGLVAARLGAGRSVVLGLLVMAAGGTLGALAGGDDLLLVARVIEGAGYLASGTAAPVLVAAGVAPRQRTLALSLWGTTVPLGSALALVIAPPVIGLGGWRDLWFVVAGLAVVTALAVILARGRVAAVAQAARGPAGSAPARGPLIALRSPPGWIGALIFSAYSLQFWALLNWLPTALGEVGRLSLGVAALVTAAVVAMNALGNLAGGALLRRGWQRPALIGGASLVMGLAGIAMNQHGLPDGIRLAACFVLSGVGGVIPAALVSSAPLLVERQSETGYFQGFFMQGAALGQFAGPIAAAAAVAAAGGDWAATVWVTAGAAAIAILLAALLSRTVLGRAAVRTG